MAHNLWTKTELIQVFNLYLKIPFGKISKSNPEVIKMAQLISRTPSSIAMRLANFAHVDPFHQQRGIGGLAGGSNQCQPIWDEFIANKEAVLFESERVIAESQQNTIEIKYSKLLAGTENLQGETKIREVKTRVNQHIFRQIVLANYSNRCAITGIDLPDLLVASHIIPWSENEKERLNPENGICLSNLYDKAFDKGLITIDKNLKIQFSKELRQKHNQPYFNQFFAGIEGESIQISLKYAPKKDFLAYHTNHIFKG